MPLLVGPLRTLGIVSLLTLSLFTQCSVAEPGVVNLSFEKKHVSVLANPAGRIRRRASTAQATLYNAEGSTLYLINSTVGTPPQSIALQVDTGSSDIWLPWVGSRVCTTSGKACSNGAFDDSKSSSFVSVLPNQFDISYVDGTEIQGDYINETFSIGGATIKQMTMGLAKKAAVPGSSSSSPFDGIVGVGFDAGESVVSQSRGQIEYPNIISQMVLQGVINTRAYSLWLNDLNSPQGNILFGGIDSSKFTGDLVVLPLQQNAQTNTIDTFTVTFAGLEIDGNGGKVVYNINSTAPVILDSGTSLTYLPDDIANAIIAGVGAVNSDTYGVVVPCEVGTTQGIFKFKFGNANGPVVSAKISQFVIPFASNVRAPKFKSGSTACQWGILPAGDNPNLFGDTFLRSAFVVYNLDGNTVAIAEANFNAKDSNVKQITATDSIPGATSTATGTAKQTHTGAISQSNGFLGGDATTTVASATGTFDLGAPSSSSGGKKSAATGLQPPTAFVGTIFSGLAVLFAVLGGSALILA